jgi:hypothetical protein
MCVFTGSLSFCQNGVDVNSMARVLLRSVKPALHANVNCTPLVAAVMSRQISTVKLLIEVSAITEYLLSVLISLGTEMDVVLCSQCLVVHCHSYLTHCFYLKKNSLSNNTHFFLFATIPTISVDSRQPYI